MGGCVTEYESGGWRLFVDYGEQLPGAPGDGKPLEVDGLTKGDLSKSALLITHYHGDHIGKIADLPEELPIYIGKTAKDIALKFTSHMGFVDAYSAKIAERLKTANTFNAGEQFEIGDLKIMPIIMDHSAFDAYAFHIEGDGVAVFHTGDFRTHGFRSRNLPAVIEKYVGRVDYVVSEATNVKRPDANNIPEHELWHTFEDKFRDNKYNVVYMSSTNIDRIFGLYHAAVNANRPFYADPYQKSIMDAVAGRATIWGKSKTYRYKDGHEPTVLLRNGEDFLYKDKYHDFLSKHGYVLVARANDRFDRLIAQMPSDGRKTYLSMWKGYVNPDLDGYSPSLAKSLSSGYEYLHTSGHCDMQSLDDLFEMLHPRAIIPIHTDDPKAFAELFSEKWPVVLLEDGESVSTINNVWDATRGSILCRKSPGEDITETSNPEKLPWWTLQSQIIGEFYGRKGAIETLKRTVYAPKRAFGYEITEDCDFELLYCDVYNLDFSLYSAYPGPDSRSQSQKKIFAKGERVYAIIGLGSTDVILPCEIISPVIRKPIRDSFTTKGIDILDCYEKYADHPPDKVWDKYSVRPLVRVSNSEKQVRTTVSVPRVCLFPYSLKNNETLE